MNTYCYAQSTSIYMVRNFGENMHKWCSTKESIYRESVANLCAPECRINDQIAADFNRNANLNLEHYVIDNYLNGYEMAFDRGNVTFNISNLKDIHPIMYSQEYGYNAKLIKDYSLVVCDIVVSGVLNYHITDLFYINKDKREIVKIAPYKEITDRVTGKKKVEVDFSDLEPDVTLGITYNYSKHFPIGLSFNYSPGDSYFMVSVDLGLSLKKDNKYIIDKVEMQDIMNFEREIKTYDKMFYLTITPQAFFKYFSIGCGGGALFLYGKKEVWQNNNNIPSGHTLLVKPMIRPVAKGFIPVSDECQIAVSIGYDMAFGYKEKNGFNYGIGLQWEL